MSVLNETTPIRPVLMRVFVVVMRNFSTDVKLHLPKWAIVLQDHYSII